MSTLKEKVDHVKHTMRDAAHRVEDAVGDVLLHGEHAEHRITGRVLDAEDAIDLASDPRTTQRPAAVSAAAPAVTEQAHGAHCQ
jgi:hypothetical protein